MDSPDDYRAIKILRGIQLLAMALYPYPDSAERRDPRLSGRGGPLDVVARSRLGERLGEVRRIPPERLATARPRGGRSATTVRGG
jgi:hypothetical protein